MDTNTQPLLQWNPPIHPIVERSARWYTIGGGIVLAIAAYGILSGSWPLAVVSVLCGAIYFLLRDHTPRTTMCALYETGLMYDGQFRRWDEFAGFWILETPTHTELRLSPKGSPTELVIQITGMDARSMRLAVGTFLTELTEKRESLIDIFSRIAKL